jgi:predicted DNA binding CopG/RHH family protein
MRDHYDFGNMKGTRNPYVGRLKESITIRLDRPTVAYFRALAAELGMPYQSLINLYLRDCVVRGRKLEPRWIAARTRSGARKTPAR